MRTAGRTVAFSAATVAAALARWPSSRSASRSRWASPARSSRSSPRSPRSPSPPRCSRLWGRKLARKRDAPRAHDRWHRFAHAVMRRPGVIAAVTAAVMLAVALPAPERELDAGRRVGDPDGPELAGRRGRVERDFGGAGRRRSRWRSPRRVGRRGAAFADACQRRRRRALGRAPARSAATRGGSPSTVPGDPAGEAAQYVVDDIRSLDPGSRRRDRSGGGVHRPAGRDRLASAARGAAPGAR